MWAEILNFSSPGSPDMARKTRILAAVGTVLLASLGPQKGFWTQARMDAANCSRKIGHMFSS